jgi:2-polyprenyl-3-methyl-5-hydroxy-6-metoxy-1,4-benzoquinol methylase
VTLEFFWDRGNATRMGQYLTRVEGQFIEEGLAAAPWARKVLDIGGGSGRFALPLHARGYHVVVTDADSVPLRLLTSHNPHVGRVLTSASAASLTVASQSVDCVLCIEVFGLSDQACWFFPECHRVLREGGLLIFTAHNKLSYKGLLRRVRQETRFYSRSIGDIRQRLRAAGFTVLREQGFNWLPATRLSNNRLIPFLGSVGKSMHMGSAAAQFSPWVLVLARKGSEIAVS